MHVSHTLDVPQVINETERMNLHVFYRMWVDKCVSMCAAMHIIKALLHLDRYCYLGKKSDNGWFILIFFPQPIEYFWGSFII